MLLVAPLLVCPSLSLLVWVINVLVSGDDERQDTGVLNLVVPGAQLKSEKGLDKMAYYRKADTDSALQQKKMVSAMPEPAVQDTGGLGLSRDVNELKIGRKLAELKDLVNGNRGLAAGAGNNGLAGGMGTNGLAASMANRERGGEVVHAAVSDGEIERLERMMRSMKEARNEPDPEMRELNRTLDKLMAVQHPDRVRDTSGSGSGSGSGLAAGASSGSGSGLRLGLGSGLAAADKGAGTASLPVSAAAGGIEISGWKASSDGGNRFYDLDNNGREETSTGTMIEAVIPENQKLINGGYLRLELSTELIINGDRIPAGTPLVGSTRLTNERLEVMISAIHCGARVYPVALKVLDQDGIAGIYVPGSVADEAAREAVGQGIGTIGVSSPDASILGQATNVGVQLARSMAGKKVRKAPVTIPKNHWVFLEDVSVKH